MCTCAVPSFKELHMKLEALFNKLFQLLQKVDGCRYKMGRIHVSDDKSSDLFDIVIWKLLTFK